MKILGTIIILIALLVGGWFAYQKFTAKQLVFMMSEVETGKVYAVDPQKLPDGFEANKLPLETNVPFVDSNELFLEGGGVQSMMSYVSEKRIEDIVDSYRQYFEQNRWNLLLATTTNNMRILATQSKDYPGAHLDITIEPADNKKAIVSVYLVRRALKREL